MTALLSSSSGQRRNGRIGGWSPFLTDKEVKWSGLFSVWHPSISRVRLDVREEEGGYEIELLSRSQPLWRGCRFKIAKLRQGETQEEQRSHPWSSVKIVLHIGTCCILGWTAEHYIMVILGTPRMTSLVYSLFLTNGNLFASVASDPAAIGRRGLK